MNVNYDPVELWKQRWLDRTKQWNEARDRIHLLEKALENARQVTEGDLLGVLDQINKIPIECLQKSYCEDAIDEIAENIKGHLDRWCGFTRQNNWIGPITIPREIKLDETKLDEPEN